MMIFLIPERCAEIDFSFNPPIGKTLPRKFIITGQLGDVKKESASIALDYLKANKEKYGLDDKAFDKQDIHIHVPEGAIKKDGPSAGVTLTTAIYSAFTNKPVRDDVLK